jgi:hypothetical protein
LIKLSSSGAPGLFGAHAVQETDQQCFATDGAVLPQMVARQSSVIAAFKGVPNIPFGGLMRGLRQLGNVLAGILERHELAASW